MRKLRSYDILDYLKKRKRCTLAELMERFGVSSAESSVSPSRVHAQERFPVFSSIQR